MTEGEALHVFWISSSGPIFVGTLVKRRSQAGQATWTKLALPTMWQLRNCAGLCVAHGLQWEKPSRRSRTSACRGPSIEHRWVRMPLHFQDHYPHPVGGPRASETQSLSSVDTVGQLQDHLLPKRLHVSAPTLWKSTSRSADEDPSGR